MNAPLKQLLVFRLLLVSLLLGALILLEFIWPHESASISIPIPLYCFIVLAYLLTILYARRLGKVVKLERFIHQQLLADATLIAGLLYLTGGFYSHFFPLFYLIILGGTLYLERQHTISLLFYCTFLYLLIIFAHSYNPFQGVLPLPPLLISNHKIVSQLFFNLTPFYLTAFILSFIAKERLDTRKRLQEATSDLKEFKNLNDHIIASIDSGLITTDQQLIINSINQAGNTILGLEKNKILECNLHEIIAGLPPTIENQRRQRHEIIYQQPEGRQLVLGFSFTRLRKDHNHNLGWILTFQNLTELKEIEERLQAAQKMAAIGRISAGIAHEIRNPLAAISGSIEILAKDLPAGDETHRRLLQIVLKESTRLNHLISDFLGFSRLEGKEQTITNLISLIQDIVFLFRSQFPDTRFIENYHEDDFSIKANPEQLEQIFWNLFKNALEAVDNCGEITISSRTIKNAAMKDHPIPYDKSKPEGASPTDSRPDSIIITIYDNGPGISDEISKEIFEPFFTTKATGTGLGLYIAFQLTRINNGYIKLGKRKDGEKGACAQVFFPAAN